MAQTEMREKEIEKYRRYKNKIQRMKAGRRITVKDGKKEYEAIIKNHYDYYMVVQDGFKIRRCLGYNSLYCGDLKIT